MAVSAGQLMVGPGKIWTAPEGTDDALIIAAATPSWTGWTEAGLTDGGVNLTISKKYENHTVDQVADWVASTITERHAQLETNLVNVTLDNLKLANNGGTITIGSGSGTGGSWDKYEPVNDLVATQETYIAVAIEGNTLAGDKRIVVIRRALSVDDMSFEFKKDGKTMYSVSFAGHYVSDTVPPFIVYTKHVTP